MVDPSDIEMVAMEEAGGLGGAYIQELGKTDLGEWSPEEWKGLVEVICGGYVSSLEAAQDKINRAMARVNNIP